MQTPLQITFRHMERSDTLDAHIREEVDKLETVYDRITRCHVTVDLPHRHQRHGKHFTVRVELSIPNDTIVIARDPANDTTAEEPYAAVNEAFDLARRQLQSHVDRMRGDVKRHTEH